MYLDVKSSQKKACPYTVTREYIKRAVWMGRGGWFSSYSELHLFPWMEF